ncbi:MAG TPA: hypothetical protein PK886_02380 [Candidatus Paceibacterota bacterium]|nr:hypothetical protein [Candidatus Paceibacterota bacterium]
MDSALIKKPPMSRDELLEHLLLNLDGQDGGIWIQELKKFIGKRTCWLKKLELKESNILIPALTKSFDPDERFLRNEKVKYNLGRGFKQHLLNQTKPFSGISESFVNKSVIKIETNDIYIMEEIEEASGKILQTKEEILYNLNYLTELQSGILISSYNDPNIVGYLNCDDGQIRAVWTVYSELFRFWECNVCDMDKRGAGCGIIYNNAS